MKQLVLKGCGTALITPFHDDKVDYSALRKLIERQIAAGVDFLVPLGSTAETPCLEDDEKVEILRIFRELAPDMPIVAGCGTNSLKATVANMRKLEPCSPDAFLVVVPYYNKPTQEGMYQYFKAVAESTDKSIVLYNVPGRTGSNMTAETTLRLSEIPNIVAVKEASGDVAQITDICVGKKDGFTVLSGNDDQTLPLMAAGADGVISVASNIAPALMSSLVKAVAKGDYNEAMAINNRLVPLFKGCFVESNPIPVKGGLSVMGLCENELRLPLTAATERTLKLMKNIVSDINLL